MEDDKTFYDKKSPYQFYLPLSLKRKGMRKAKVNKIPIAPFMQMAFEQFLNRPIEESLKRLRAHQLNQRRINKRKRLKKGVTL